MLALLPLRLRKQLLVASIARVTGSTMSSLAVMDAFLINSLSNNHWHNYRASVNSANALQMFRHVCSAIE